MNIFLMLKHRKIRAQRLVHLLDVGTTRTAAGRRRGTSRHAAAHVRHATGGTALLVELGHDGHGNALKLLLARLELFWLFSIQLMVSSILAVSVSLSEASILSATFSSDMVFLRE